MKINNYNLLELNNLAKEIRAKIINYVNNHQGHYSSNLGVVEITIAIHHLFDLTKDKLIFDIGHQGYPHKYLINKEQFDLIRKENGTSGLISRDDHFNDYETGHAGLAIGLGFGHALVSKNKTIILIGDGGFANGINLAGLNELAKTKNTILVINNNKMNISPSKGAIYNILNNKALAKNYFTTYGFDFYYQKDGNDLAKLISDLKTIKENTKPCVYLIETIKGLGDKNAEADKIGSYHAIASKKSGLSYPKLVSNIFFEYAKKFEPYVVQLGMTVGFNMETYPEILKGKYLDYGMNEELGLASAYALLLNNQKVVIPIYATFLQRIYDQLVNDIGRLNLAPLLLINRNGLIDYDGPTHQGIYTNSILNDANIPAYYPLNEAELKFYFNEYFKANKPMALVYSKEEFIPFNYQIKEINKYYFITKKSKKVILSYGYLLAKYLDEYLKMGLSVINTTGNILDLEMLDYLAKNDYTLYFIEDTPYESSLYLKVLGYFKSKGYPNKVYGKYIIKKDLPANSLVNLLIANTLDIDSIKLLVNRKLDN